MKKINLVVIILSMLFCSTASADEWENEHIRNKKGVPLSDSYFFNVRDGLCQVHILPSEDGMIKIVGWAVDYRKSTKNKSIEISECFVIVDDGGEISVDGEIKTITTTNKGSESVGEGYHVFDGLCAKHVEGSNIPIEAQRTLKKFKKLKKKLKKESKKLK